MSYKIHIGTDSYDILREGFSLPYVAGAMGKHEQASASFSVRDADFISQVFNSTTPLEGYITKNGVRLFTGTLRPYTTLNPRAMDLGPVSVELLDNTEKLRVYVTEDMAEKYSSETLGSLVSKLIAKAGVSFQSDTLSDSTAVPRFELAEGDYIADVLADLLYQYGYDYAFRPDGSLYYLNTDLTSESTETVTEFIGGLSIERSDDSSDGVKVTYRKAETPGVVAVAEGDLYRSAILGSLSFPSSSFDTEGTITAAYLEKSLGLEEGSIDWFKVSNLDFSAKVSGANYALVRKNSSVSLQKEDGYKLRIRGGYVSVNVGTIQVHYTIYGNLSYAKRSTTEFSISGNRPQEIDLDAVYSDAQAEKIARLEYQRQKASTTTYSFKSKETYSVGSFVTLSDAIVSGLEVKARIIRSTITDDTGVVDYECEGAEAVSVNPQRADNPSISEAEPIYLAIAEDGTEVLENKGSFTLTAIGPDASDSVEWFNGNNEKIGTGIQISVSLNPGANIFNVKSSDHEASAVIRLAVQSVPEYSETPSEGNYYVTEDGIPKIYKSGAWVDLTPSMNPAAFSACANYWLSQGKAVTQSMSALYTYTQNLYANAAVINSMFSTMITLMEGGEIKSQGFQSGVKGFRIASDGDAEFVRAKLIGAYVSGDGQFDCPSFSSLKNGGTPYPSAYASTKSSQWSAINRAFADAGLYPTSDTGYYICTCSDTSKGTVRYVQVHITGSYTHFRFYDENMTYIGAIVSGGSISSPWEGISVQFTLYIGAGDIFKFKNIPITSTGLEKGTVWNSNGTLRIVT